MKMLRLILASIGVIGGADGPTRIIVASAPGWWVLPCVIAVMIVAAVVWMIRRRKK